MNLTENHRIALLVRSIPYEHRAPRADLDLALAAVVMDYTLELYFLGSAVMHLAVEREATAALLPGGYRSWAALPDMAEVHVHARQDWLDRCERHGIRLVLPVEGLDETQMKRKWRQCGHVMVI